MVDTTYYLDEGAGGGSGSLPCGEPGNAACYDVGDAPGQLMTRTMIIALINSMLGGGVAGTLKKMSFITTSQTYTFTATTTKVLTLLIGAGGGGGYMLMGGGAGALLLGLKTVSPAGAVNVTIGAGGAGGVTDSGTLRHGGDGGQTSFLSFAVNGGRGGYGYGVYSSLEDYGHGGGVYSVTTTGILWAKAGGSSAPNDPAAGLDVLGYPADKLFISEQGASPLSGSFGMPFTVPLITLPGIADLSPSAGDAISYFTESNWYGTPPGEAGLYGYGGGAGNGDIGLGGGSGGGGLVIIVEME